MFEQLCYTIIKELGPTGLLIIGLYYILDKTNKELIKELKVINDEIKELSVNLDRIASAKKKNMAKFEGTQNIPSELLDLYRNSLNPHPTGNIVKKRYPHRMPKMQEGGGE